MRKEQFLASALFAATLVVTPWYAATQVLPEERFSPQLRPVAPIPVLRSRVSSGTFSELDYTLQTVVSAQAVYVVDATSASVLLEKNADTPVPPASTTKLMAALVALEHYAPGTVLTVGDAAGTDGGSAHLFRGETLTVEALLQATLIASANDAVLVFAENYPGGVPAFVAAMNARAEELHLENTHFTNPVGFDNPAHMSTARDLAILAQEALKNPQIAQTVNLQQATIFDSTGRYSHTVVSTNELLRQDPTVHGVKTGTTDQAGQVLITLVEREGHPVIIALLNSPDRFTETAQLINWIYDQYQWMSLESVAALPAPL